MTDARSDEIEGITLAVYMYIVKKGQPCGPRDVMKGADLSSPSVAYRHLEKLEELGLLGKNEYGEYFLREKARLHGYVWVGKRVLPKMLAYSFLFFVILIVEFVIFYLHYPVEDFKFYVFFLLLMLVTGSAAGVFFIEGLMQRGRTAVLLQQRT